MIESFAGYSFCKPHSASYALVSFKSAYLKAHFPAAFIAAVISNQGGYYPPR
jgi:error-prone DNA polymerase